ncbi:MAG: hypothetical protein C0494_15815 [Sphingobium sp.]|nr:hypothetical protein [Sphingobium sp.]
MAMFAGQFKQRKGPFDFTPETYGTPGIGDGLPGAKIMGDPGLGITASAPVTPKQGVNWMGILADTLAGAAGQPGPYAARMAQERQLAQQETLYQRRLKDQRDTWLAQQQWERANPAPRAPHYWETNDGSLGVIGADGKPTIAYKDPTPKVDWITATNPDGTKTLYPMQQGGGGLVSDASRGATAPASSNLEPDMILNRARQQGFISPEDRASLERQLGPNGRTALDGWLTSSKVKTGRQVSGKTYYQVNGKWFDNPEGR